MRYLTVLISIAIVVSACADRASQNGPGSTAVPASPTASGTTSTPAATIAPTGAGSVLDIFVTRFDFKLSNASQDTRWPTMIYDALYRLSDDFSPVPDLAAEPCTMSGDGRVFTCTLVDTTFHDGAPLTADDVAYTYDLRLRPTCVDTGRFPPGIAIGGPLRCVGDSYLDSVTALDDRTVEFRLSRPDARFLTLVLPNVFIDQMRIVERDVQLVEASLGATDPASLEQLAAAIDDALGATTPDCQSHVAEAERVLASPGLGWLLPPDLGDTCDFLGRASPALYGIAEALRVEGMDRTAALYPLLAFNRQPVGTGPWKFVALAPYKSLELEAFAGYHLGRPAIDRINVRTIIYFDEQLGHLTTPEELDGLLTSGELDIVARLSPDDARRMSGWPGITVANYVNTWFEALQYNVRPDRLFADVRLRRAVQLCVDKTRTVDAATNGGNPAIESPVAPSSWAFRPGLAPPGRDVDAARSLIDAAGWSEGPDGIYRQGDRRLSADLVYFGDWAWRGPFVDLVVEQTRDCGMELVARPLDLGAVNEMIEVYPHVQPGTDHPFDAYFGGVNLQTDPVGFARSSLFHSADVTSADQPDGGIGRNWTGFTDPRVDDLIAAGYATYDQTERARIYRDLQGVLVEQQPYYFGFATAIGDAVSEEVASRSGPLNFESPLCYWRQEDLTLTGP